MAEKLRMDDILINYVGQLGLYQKVHYFLVGIPVIFAGMHSLSWTFIGAPLKYRCLYPGENSTSSYQPDTLWHNSVGNLTSVDQCRRIAGVRFGDQLTFTTENLTFEKCRDGYSWDHSDFQYSAVDRWSLVCDRDYIVPTVQALFFVGKLLGSLFFGILSDRFGRKPVFIFAILLQMISGSTQAVAPSWGLMAFLRTVTGFCSSGVFIMSVVVGAELVGPKYRVWSAIVAGIFWAIGEMILGGLSYPLRDYRYLQLAISLPAILLLCYWWILPESPRWLLAQDRYEEVDSILARVAEWNGKSPPPKDWYERLGKEERQKIPWCKSTLMLFASPRLRRRVLASFLIWAVAAMGYYGLAINPAFMGGDNRLGFILSGMMEIPGQLFVLLVNIIGRKIITFGGFLLAGLCIGLTLAVPPAYPWWSLFLVVVGKSALMAVFATIYIWTPEHYPTMVRNTAVGTCSTFSRLGAIAASYISLKLAREHPHIVALTIAIASILVAAVTLLLPETTGEQLTETMEEAEGLGVGQPVFILGYRHQKLVAERTPESKRNS